MMPLKFVPVALPSPKVSVFEVPEVMLSTVPAPESPLMVSLKPARSINPEVRTTLPLPKPFGICSAAPRARVVCALLIVVVPE